MSTNLQPISSNLEIQNNRQTQQQPSMEGTFKTDMIIFAAILCLMIVLIIFIILGS